jgi:hypothetical protein
MAETFQRKVRLMQRKSKPAKGKAIKKTASKKLAKSPARLVFTEPALPLELVATAAFFAQLSMVLTNAAQEAAHMANTYERWAGGEPFDGEKVESDRAAFGQIVRPPFANAHRGLTNVLNFIPEPVKP